MRRALEALGTHERRHSLSCLFIYVKGDCNCDVQLVDAAIAALNERLLSD